MTDWGPVIGVGVYLTLIVLSALLTWYGTETEEANGGEEIETAVAEPHTVRIDTNQSEPSLRCPFCAAPVIAEEKCCRVCGRELKSPEAL